jgi:hypothetical protein
MIDDIGFVLYLVFVIGGAFYWKKHGKNISNVNHVFLPKYFALIFGFIIYVLYYFGLI